jgi:hypothetical protein
MFDRCRGWRRQLTRRADGTLPIKQWGALEDHLTRCPCCRANDEADRALREVCNLHSGLLSTEAADAFDDRVLAALKAPATPAMTLFLHLAGPWRHLAARVRALPFTFLMQLGGSALVAASLTTICLMSALHPTASSPVRPPIALEAPAMSTADRNDPPVSLDWLLQSPSPRAALLWTTPVSVRDRHPASHGLLRHPENTRMPLEPPFKTPVQREHHGEPPTSASG